MAGEVAMTVASVSWAIAGLGWVVQPISTRFLNQGFDLLSETAKLDDQESQLLQKLNLMWEKVERITPDEMAPVKKWANELRYALLGIDVGHFRRLDGKEQKEFKEGLNKLQKVVENAPHVLQLPREAIKEVKIVSKGALRVLQLPAETTKEEKIGTTSSALAPVMVGRDKEVAKIIKMLSEAPAGDEPGSSNSTRCPTIGIYGITKSGKTTLAQYVYNCTETKDKFSLTTWIDVSQSFSVRGIFEEMLEAAKGEPSLEFKNLDTLEKKLKAELREKRFLLVLDGLQKVVTEEEREKLLQLLNTGSKILVTACSQDVVASLGAKSPMELLLDLNEEDANHLLMHYALDDRVKLDDQARVKLQLIAKDISRKLSSPWAACQVGKQLEKRIDADCWQTVKEDHPFADAMKYYLWQRYLQLDVQVRRCFAYCCMLSRMYQFNRDALVYLWMEEGFIKTEDDCRKKMKKAGEKFFNELMSRSFIKSGGNSTDGGEWFTIPDTLHELVEMFAGSYFFRVQGDEVKEIPSDVRHLFISSRNATNSANKIIKMKKLRTLIISAESAGESRGITADVLNRMLGKLSKLEVVHVYVQSDGEVVISKSIHDMKKLCLLSISGPQSQKVTLHQQNEKEYDLKTPELPILRDSNCPIVKNTVILRKNRDSWDFPGIMMQNEESSGSSDAEWELTQQSEGATNPLLS